jgi:hypothetical protein
MIVLNCRNGLPFNNYFRTEHYSMFLSSHAHHANCYFQSGDMPISAIIELLKGGIVTVVDASTSKPFPDALVTGLGSWVIAFNRGLKSDESPEHSTPAMRKYAYYSDEAKRVKQTVRRLKTVYGDSGPAKMHLWNGRNTQFVYNSKAVQCSFPTKGPAVVAVGLLCNWDDKPEVMRKIMFFDAMTDATMFYQSAIQCPDINSIMQKLAAS